MSLALGPDAWQLGLAQSVDLAQMKFHKIRALTELIEFDDDT